MSVLYRPIISPNPITPISGNDYTLSGYIAVSDNEDIQYMGRNENDEFQFNIISSTEPAGNKPFSEGVEKINSQPTGKVVTNKDGEEVGESVFDFG